MITAQATDISLAHDAPHRHDGKEPAQLFPPLADDPEHCDSPVSDRDPIGFFLGGEIPFGIVQPARKLVGTAGQEWLFGAERGAEPECQLLGDLSLDRGV